MGAATVETERGAAPHPQAPQSPRSRPSAARRVRPRWWPELLLILVGERIYEYIRNLVPTHRALAEEHGWSIERLEQTLRLNFGLSLNRFVDHHEPLAQVLNYYYATLHFCVTGAVMIWLFAARPVWYRQMRTILVITTVIGLAGFYLYPLAPPRLLPDGGYIDTVVRFKTWGSWADPTVATHSNQYAAMPSLHIAWALWCGYVLYRITHRRWVMAAAIVYPMCTLLVIIATANHYLLDAVAGAAVFAAAVALEYAARTALRAGRGSRSMDRTGVTSTSPAVAAPAVAAPAVAAPSEAVPATQP